MVENKILEDFLNEQAADSNFQRLRLIRILSRSATLPKVSDLQVKYIQSQPEMFLIEPGAQLRIGIRLLEYPVLALVALRYGIEWHIWYKAMENQYKIQLDSRIADLAAARAALKFIDLLPNEERKELDENFPDDLKNLYRKLRQSEFNQQNFEHLDLSDISKFHKLRAPHAPLNKYWLSMVKQLALPTETLLMTGGDQRLNIDTNSLLNKYGCRPFPRPEAYTFASSTATSVSNIGFYNTQKKREKLIQQGFIHGLNQAYDRMLHHITTRIRHIFQIDEDTQLAFAPSGTDISLLFAGFCQNITKNPVVHILVASDETGSGVPMALAGKHFADTSALMKKVKKNTLVKGYRPTEVVHIPLRRADGKLRPKQEIDTTVEELIERCISAKKHPVLHVMDQSKLGYAAPSQTLLTKLERFIGDYLTIMVDNSQFRMSADRFRDYCKRGFFVTITGSKFFTGPPFSGALIIPQQYNNYFQDSDDTLPEGLESYYFKSDVRIQGSITKSLANGVNIGSVLRWQAALTEIERFYSVPISLRELGANLFCEYVEKRIAQSEFLQPLNHLDHEADLPLAFESRTIHPFFIIKDQRTLTHDEATQLYTMLNQDIQELLPAGSTSEEKRIARQACHIGQPVKAIYSDGSPSAVLRISLGARVIAEGWNDRDVSLYFQHIEEQISQVDTVINKIGMILKYTEHLTNKS